MRLIRKLLKSSWFNGDFDNNGIYLYKGVDGKNYYSVINLAQYAIGSYLLYLKTNDIEWRKEFLKHCDWLINNQDNYKGNSGVWINKYEMSKFNLENNWISSLSQAFGISALTRAYLETNDNKYLISAKKASQVFSISVSDGGVFCEKEPGFICLEEYPTDNPSYVLNGHIFALWSIYDLLRIIDDNKLEQLLERLINSLINNLHRWDLNYWSRYDLYENHFNVSSYFYHNLHIKQLKILYKITNEKVFLNYSGLWEDYRDNYFFRIKAFLKKVYFRLF